MNWFAFLSLIAAPIAKRVFIALGLAVVSYAGVQSAAEAAFSAAAGNLSGLPSLATQLLAMSGIFQGLSMIAGAWIARLSLIPLKRIIVDGA